MKKYTINFLILIALIGIFIPVTRTASAAENCSFAEAQNQEECESLGYTWTPSSVQNSGASGSGFFCKWQGNPKFQDLLSYATCIINSAVIPLIFALAVVMFVWGVVQFVINSDEEAKKEKGKQFMIWGIIALAVMVSIWGLVKILGNTFGIEYVIPRVKP